VTYAIFSFKKTPHILRLVEILFNGRRGLIYLWFRLSLLRLWVLVPRKVFGFIDLMCISGVESSSGCLLRFSIISIPHGKQPRPPNSNFQFSTPMARGKTKRGPGSQEEITRATERESKATENQEISTRRAAQSGDFVFASLSHTGPITHTSTAHTHTAALQSICVYTSLRLLFWFWRLAFFTVRRPSIYHFTMAF